jgi:hypothetical protein
MVLAVVDGGLEARSYNLPAMPCQSENMCRFHKDMVVV